MEYEKPVVNEQYMINNLPENMDLVDIRNIMSKNKVRGYNCKTKDSFKSKPEY